MIDTVYVEQEVQNHPRVDLILSRLKPKRIISIERYSEIFNRKGQNFRLQKKKPSLILAKKYGDFLHKIPPTFGIGSSNNYYFSHALNCPFDCSYCFLQGMYRSAHFVIFINYEDFQKAIVEKGEATFFSGYDADSFALEPTTGFVQEFIPFFQKNPKAFLEIRTKSILTRPLLMQDLIPNCVIAYSLNPENIVQNLEKKTPSLAKRLQALEKLQQKGWKVCLRFDPVIYQKDFEPIYRDFFKKVFTFIDISLLHSATLGSFRLPKPFYKNMQKIGSDPKLLAVLQEDDQMSYPKEIEKKMIDFCTEEILKYMPRQKLFLM